MAIDENTPVMAQDPTQIVDSEDRALLVFAQWHIDEETSEQQAVDYAQRLLERLKEFNLFVVRTK